MGFGQNTYSSKLTPFEVESAAYLSHWDVMWELTSLSGWFSPEGFFAEIASIIYAIIPIFGMDLSGDYPW